MNRRTYLATATTSMTLALAGCSSGVDSGKSVVSVKEKWFDPIQRSVEVGTTVTWVNDDMTILPEHTVTSEQIHENAATWEFDATLEETDDEVSYTFEQEGIYTYIDNNAGEDCMCGAILVGDVSLDNPKTLPCESASGGGGC